MSFLRKFGPKTENCQIQVKFNTYSMVMFTLSVFERKYPFYGKFVLKYQNCLLKLKFRNWTTSNDYVEFDGDFHFIF